MSRLALALLPLLGACGASPAPVERAAPRMDYLVIVEDGEMQRTEWSSDDGVLRGRAEGVILGVGDRLYRFESRSERVALRTCGEIDDDDEPGASASGTVASALLVGLGGEASVTLIRATVDEGMQDYAHHAESHRVIGALGDRVVIVSRRERNGCGAHDDLGVTVRTFDLGTGQELFATDEENTARNERGPEALAAMRAFDPARTESCLGRDLTTAAYRTTVPAFGAEGLMSHHLYVASPVSQPCRTLAAPTSAYEWGFWLEGPGAELPALYEEREIPAPVLARASRESAIGVTWLEANRAPMGDAFALASE